MDHTYSFTFALSSKCQHTRRWLLSQTPCEQKEDSTDNIHHPFKTIHCMVHAEAFTENQINTKLFTA